MSEKAKSILGFAENPPCDFDQDLFVSKLGGKPKWLIYNKPLPATQVMCGNCKSPLVLLLQLYAPEDEPKQAFHRMLYVFICRNGKCHRGPHNLIMKVFRSQITEENDYYYETQAETSRMSDVDDVENKDVDIVWKLKQTVKKPLLCSICGLSGNFMCSQCKNKRYCSKEHQLLDWSYGGHKFDCHSEHSSAQSNSGKVDVVNIGNSKFTNYLFKEMEIISEVEEIEIKAKPDPIDDKLPVLVQKGNEIDEEAEEDSKVEVDRPFLDFQETIRHNPDQVIRYARNPDYDQNAEPLFVSDKSDFDVPNCQLCGSKREFELQIMPQMLNYLQRPGNNSNDLEYIDWGTLLIYTCPNNCELPPDQNYTPEVIIRQNFTSDGIGGRYYKASMGLYTEEGVIDDAFDQIQI